MGLKEVLAKMKLVEADGEPRAAEPRSPSEAPTSQAPRASTASAKPRAASVKQILESMPPAPRINERMLQPEDAGSQEDGPDFAQVYKAAGVKEPAHGFSAEKVLEILSSPDLAALDPKSRAAALASFLKMNPAGPVPISDVLQDAVRRDQALDACHALMTRRIQARTEELVRANADLQAEVDALLRRNEEKMEANRKALDADRGHLSRWEVRKRLEERRLYEAVALFVEDNPISVTDPAGSMTDEG